MSEPRRPPPPAAAAATAGPPFRAERIALVGAELTPLASGEAGALGAAFAAMDPWAAYRMQPAQLATFFAAVEPEAPRWAIRCDGRLAGAVVVRFPWLHGPYLQFLGLLPHAQGQGLGRAVLDWMEREASPRSRNLWLCVSAINVRAKAFYERQGFVHAATLDALVAEDMDEILMRKRTRLPSAPG